MLWPDSAGIWPEQESCPGFRHPKNWNENRNVQPSDQGPPSKSPVAITFGSCRRHILLCSSRRPLPSTFPMPGAAADRDACRGGANAVSAAGGERGGGSRTKPCAAHPTTRVVRPIAVVVPLAARQSGCLSSSMRSALVEDMDMDDNDDDDDGSGGLLAKYVVDVNDEIIIIVDAYFLGGGSNKK